MSFDQFNDGWVRLDSNVYYLWAFWVEPFPKDETTRDHESPIWKYHDGGIGAVQWVNVTRNTAAILKADGGWKEGGAFHLWISPGAGTLPYEVQFAREVRVDAGDPDGWAVRKRQAIELAESFLGLTPQAVAASR